MPTIDRGRWWRYARALAGPLLLWGLVVATLREPIQTWLSGEQKYDRAALKEWLQEARVFRETLPEMIDRYLAQVQACRDLAAKPDDASNQDQLLQCRIALSIQREEIHEHLRSLGEPVTKMYPGQLPLFPTIYRFQIRFAGEPESQWITWDSELPSYSTQYQDLEYDVRTDVTVSVRYQLHAYNRQQRNEQVAAQRHRWIIGLAVAGTALAFLWLYLVQQRTRERERQRELAQHQINQAERLLLEEELRRRDAERRQEETERKLLEQRLATQAAEGKALELKSQLYASIGIMAGSYAHNIKNLLVRPNDLLRRCLEADGLSSDQEQMLHEVRQTLGTVTERLQQILRTVRRDPSRSELTRLDLNQQVRELHETWKDLARDKWKLTLNLELASEPLWIAGDVSHLQQAVENLLFNARDATFEMRNQLRDQAHRAHDLVSQERRQALITAAAWRGSVTLRTRREADRVLLEVEDNGIGMTEEVRRHCTETHFSTKRDNAIYEGNSTGMGLGLSFVVAILEHHQATLTIESEPLQGTTFRASFPASK